MFIKFSVVGEVTSVIYVRHIPSLRISLRIKENVGGNKFAWNTLTNVQCSKDTSGYWGELIEEGWLIYAEGKIRSMSETKTGTKKKEAVRFFIKQIIVIKHELDNPFAKKEDSDFGMREDEEYDTYEGESVK